MVKYSVLALCGALLAGCAGTSEISRSDSGQVGWNVTDVAVTVPAALSVSTDPDTRFPDRDIVWWEDPDGDRKAQVADLIDVAATRAISGLGGQPVVLQVEVDHFHAVTPKARAGGLFSFHDILLHVTPVDAASGAPVGETVDMQITRNALAGNRAKRAMARGETQRARISAEITAQMARYLAKHGG
ncbi:DUF6778 family protein [Algicella marina]|uniref:Lipoprotein n=1 Tax=Algicella marina TaxID=2683284 RepID=A0A6P1SZG8_9RHOB|nr:DUF6778 family protein [Algicella marina]QHQ35868.1 hypothetical protein GO499_12130 [Algicella marina]